MVQLNDPVSRLPWVCSQKGCQPGCGHLRAWLRLEDLVPRWRTHVAGTFSYYCQEASVLHHMTFLSILIIWWLVALKVSDPRETRQCHFGNSLGSETPSFLQILPATRISLNNVGGHCPRPWLSLRQELSRVNSESGCQVHLSVSFWSSGCEILASWDPYVSNRFLKILELKWTTYPEAIIHNTFSRLNFFFYP